MTQRRAFLKLPPYGAGQRIGLFGGSFNPAHAGHAHVTLTALRRLQLDWLWVLVTPGNPLKKAPQLSLEKRIDGLQMLLQHPRIVISDFEARAGTRYTLETVQVLKKHAPDARFVWIMGADNLKDFHRWQGWQQIAQILPIAVVDRAEGQFSSENSKAAQYLGRYYISPDDAATLADCAPPAWTFLHGRHVPLSSTVLRNARTS